MPRAAAVTTTPSPEIAAAPTTAPVETVPAEVEALVLGQVAQAMGWDAPSGVYPRLELVAEGNTYRLACVVAAGHSVDIRIQRFQSRDEAQDAFEAAREGHPIQGFYEVQATAWHRDERPDNPAMPMRHRYHLWQAERWLVTVHSFDDTHFAIAPAPRDVSEVVYQAALEKGLFAD